MSNIEKDIKLIDGMVKEYNTFGDLDNPDYEDTDRIYKAIENILKRIQELEEENRIQRKQIMSAYNRGWIPKQKVKDLIENETINISGFECIAVEDLEELLEESK